MARAATRIGTAVDGPFMHYFRTIHGALRRNADFFLLARPKIFEHFDHLRDDIAGPGNNDRIADFQA